MLRFLNFFRNFGSNKRHPVVLTPSQTVDPAWVPRALVRSRRAKLGVTQGRLGFSDSAGTRSTSASDFIFRECRRQGEVLTRSDPALAGIVLPRAPSDSHELQLP
jgi:hypothetical protein